MPAPISTARRSLLLGSLAAGGAVALAACADDAPAESAEPATPATPTTSDAPAASDAPATSDAPAAAGPRVLLAFFSRPGENYSYGGRTDLEVGNTAVLAGLIGDRTGCDVHEIRAAEPYSDDYDATVARNSQEQDADARPEVADPLPDLAAYDVVLLGSPIWNVRPPMIMRTFTDALDFTGKTVHPVVTYAVSGLGTAEEDYRDACPGAELGRGLAVQGEEVADSGPQVDDWLRQVGLTPA